MEDSQSSPSRNLIQTRNSTKTIPLDLTLEILSRLPAKSLIRFQSVSKLWFSIIRSKDFANTFLTRSKTRRRLLFTFKHFDTRKRFIFSAPEHNEDKTSSVIARHDMTISGLAYYISSRPVNGLICCTRGSSIAVCNPTTRTMEKLPDVERKGREMHARLGYDPIEDQYKVLCVMMFDAHDGNRIDKEQEHFVFTLRCQQKEWRKIEIIEGDPYTSVEGGICINGAIYYGVGHTRILRFDVRSEKIEFIKGHEDDNAVSYYSPLIDYKGELACFSYDYDCVSEMCLKILRDVEKQEWSTIMTCAVSCEWQELFMEEKALCYGEINANEVMMVSRSLESSKNFCVYYCDLIRESITRGEVQGIADSEFRRVHGIGKHGRELLCFPSHIENIIYLS